jgi:hypothetical protein
MKFPAGKANQKGLVWQIARLLVISALLATSSFLSAQIRKTEQKTMVLDMSWKRGDDHYGPNFIHLESACLSNSAPGCFCSVDFKVTTSKDFADYIESFGSNKVPVKYRVDYDRNHRIVGAILEGVGEWPVERFHVNERSHATGFRMVPGKGKGGGYIRNPGDCFPNPTN